MRVLKLDNLNLMGRSERDFLIQEVGHLDEARKEKDVDRLQKAIDRLEIMLDGLSECARANAENILNKMRDLLTELKEE